MEKEILINCENRVGCEGTAHVKRTLDLRKGIYLILFSHLSALVIFITALRSWHPAVVFYLTDIIQLDATPFQPVISAARFPYPLEQDLSDVNTKNSVLDQFLRRRGLGTLDRIPLYFLQEHLLALQSPSNICEEYDNDDLVIVVLSAYNEFDRRDAIRITWGADASDLGIPTVFVLGTNSWGQWAEVKEEAELYQDVVVANFVDSKDNHTLKTVSAVKWVHQNCRKQFVLMVDDDVLVNVQQLLKYIKTNGDNLTGSVASSSRNTLSNRAFGSGYLMALDSVGDIHVESLILPYSSNGAEFILESVVGSLNIRRVIDERFDSLNGVVDACSYPSLILKHGVTERELVRMWEKVHEPVNCNNIIDINSVK